MSFGLNRKGLNASPRNRQLIGNKGYLDVLVLPVVSGGSQNQHCANTASTDASCGQFGNRTDIPAPQPAALRMHPSPALTRGPARSPPETGSLGSSLVSRSHPLGISGVTANGPVRAPQERAVSAVLGLQPAVASGTAFNGLTAVAATEGFLCLDRQSLAASGTGGSSVVAIWPIRAAVEGASVPGVFAPLQAPFDTPWAGYVAFRQPPEDSDVVPVIDQFQNEGRRRIAIRKQEDTALGASDGDVEQAALLGVRMPFG